MIHSKKKTREKIKNEKNSKKLKLIKQFFLHYDT